MERRRPNKGLINLTIEENAARIQKAKEKCQGFLRYREKLLVKINPDETHILGLLTKLGLRFQREKGVLDGSDFCIADFFIRTPYYTVIEVDGPYHDSPKQKIRDAYKDAVYRRRGYTCLRIHHTEIPDIKTEQDLLYRLASVEPKFKSLLTYCTSYCTL